MTRLSKRIVWIAVLLILMGLAFLWPDRLSRAMLRSRMGDISKIELVERGKHMDDRFLGVLPEPLWKEVGIYLKNGTFSSMPNQSGKFFIKGVHLKTGKTFVYGVVFDSSGTFEGFDITAEDATQPLSPRLMVRNSDKKLSKQIAGSLKSVIDYSNHSN